ncbi:MAG: hypothetical protein QM767_25800 [Anaeromyxobacter sp.]
MDTALFQQFAEIAYRRSGIRLSAGKEALVSSRIGKRIRILGLRDPSAYLEYLLADEGDELVNFLDVISTNFTSFFREPEHFPALGRAGQIEARRGAWKIALLVCGEFQR